MSSSKSIHIGISPSFAKEINDQPKQARGTLVQKRLDLSDADLSKVERFGIIGGNTDVPLEDIEKRPEVEWIESVGRKFAI